MYVNGGKRGVKKSLVTASATARTRQAGASPATAEEKGGGGGGWLAKRAGEFISSTQVLARAAHGNS